MMSKENPFSRHCPHLFTQTEFYFSPEREREKRERKKEKTGLGGEDKFCNDFFLAFGKAKDFNKTNLCLFFSSFFSRCVQVAYHHFSDFTIVIIQYL